MDPRWRKLHELAKHQHGHFTTRQAEDMGLTRPAIHYQLRQGLVARAERGIYRFATFPESAHEREAVLMLWSRHKPGVAFSHETSLAHFELADAFPSKYHLTVPKAFRRRPPRDVILHKAELEPEDVHQEEILRFTTPTRTILDLIHEGFPVEQLRIAYEQALSRGLIRRGALGPGSERVDDFLCRLSPPSRNDLLHRLQRVTEAA